MLNLGTRQASVVLISGLLLAGGLAGCSSSSSSSDASASASGAPTAEQTPNNVADMEADAILKASKTAADAATSVKVTSMVETGSEQTSFNLTLTPTGSTGSMSQSMGSFELIATADTIYIKGDANFNKTFAGEEASKLLEGKWLAVPATDPQAANFAAMSSSTDFFDSLLTSDNTSALKKTSDTKDINGVTAIGLTDEGKGTLWIATTGEPYPLSIDPPEGQNGTMSFTDWNADVTVAAPPADQIVDISKLPGATSPSPAQ